MNRNERHQFHRRWAFRTPEENKEAQKIYSKYNASLVVYIPSAIIHAGFIAADKNSMKLIGVADYFRYSHKWARNLISLDDSKVKESHYYLSFEAMVHDYFYSKESPKIFTLVRSSIKIDKNDLLGVKRVAKLLDVSVDRYLVVSATTMHLKSHFCEKIDEKILAGLTELCNRISPRS